MPTIEKKPTAILATKSKYKFFLTIKYNHISFDLFADILAPSFPGESNRTIYITSIALAESFCLSLFGEKDMAYLWHHYDIIMTSQWHNIINGWNCKNILSVKKLVHKVEKKDPKISNKTMSLKLQIMKMSDLPTKPTKNRAILWRKCYSLCSRSCRTMETGEILLN